ncbi:MAG: RIP metalloprotease RseP [Candidatus Uhrbacteria bacterium]|nr:RIP metalloprotease RseP [Candidatus Uhrbacteria bacterium]
MILTVLLFILILSVLVFVHELGHFLVARACGMEVEEFGFGFPPRAAGFYFKRGGKTMYSINWIPIGGFVRIKGENGNNKNDHDSFSSKKPWQRFLVLIAGVVMNFFLAAVLFSIGFTIGLPTMIDRALPAQAHVTESHLMIMEIVADSPAARAGIVSGDAITSLDGNKIDDAEQARTYLVEHGTTGVDVALETADKSTKTVRVVSEPLKGTATVGIGVAFVRTGLVSYPFYLAIPHGVIATVQMTGDILQSFSGLIVGVFSGKNVGASLSGPVGIAVMTGQVAAMGIVYLLQFAAILSINLGVINVLPFPALDGGRIFFLIIEKLRGKAVNERFETAVNNLGFLMLMALVMFVTVKDVMHLFK